MAKTCLVVKSQRRPKFAVRRYNRCLVCGRPRAIYRKFKLCRICVRKLGLQGQIPGLTKASW